MGSGVIQRKTLDALTDSGGQSHSLSKAISVKNIPDYCSVRSPSVFRQPLQSSLCAGWRAWKVNEQTAHSGIFFPTIA